MIRKFKPYFNELHNSLINRKQRVKHFIRDRLKEPIPLLKLNRKAITSIEHKNEKLSVTSSIEKLQLDKTDFITYELLCYVIL